MRRWRPTSSAPCGHQAALPLLRAEGGGHIVQISSVGGVTAFPAAGAALLKVVDADNPPLRVFFGPSPLHFVPQVYAERLKTWEEWADVAGQAQGAAA